MRYASINEYEVANGISNGISLYVQGCDFHCPGCFNKSAWDFNGGKEWTKETEEDFLKLIDRPYIKRVSILGGEPLASQNLDGVLNLVNQIRLSLPEKSIWLYTGFVIEDIGFCKAMSDFAKGEIDWETALNTEYDNLLRNMIVSKVDVLVDGRFEDDKKDLSLQFRGSSNQRIILVRESLEQGEIILWNN